jgi:2-polyprenyl-3-methyl-5-hydroxy-6-metoxy-1,4-benzoquinol methylase
MYERLEKCPSCQNPQFENHLICQDYSVSKESFALVKCKNCNLIFTNPRPGKEELFKYYQSDDYISHTDKGNSLINFIYKLVRKYTLNKKRSLVLSLNQSGKILDYGCGTGDFIKVLSNSKSDVSGFEPDQGARELASIKSNTTIYHSLDQLKSVEKFDVITAWHVIEHVDELRNTLKILRKSLKKGGHMIIAVPNSNSYDANKYKEYWAGYDVPRHLYHFTQDSFSVLIRLQKLSLIKTLPMKFDSYYVSLLSEKYKSGSTNFIKGLLTGMKSNRLATKSTDYSSLIYILKK